MSRYILLRFTMDRYTMQGHMFLLALVALFLLQFCSIGSAFNGRCPAGWTLFQHSCYKLNTTSVQSFPNAQSECESVGATLASISSYEENRFLYELSGFYSLFWIGLSDIQQEGVFQWMDGTQFRYRWDNIEDYGGSDFSPCTPESDQGGASPKYKYCHNAELDYSDWRPLEPNNAGGNEDCVRFIPRGRWTDYPCSTKLKFMCEKGIRGGDVCPHSFETVVELGLPSKTVTWSEPAYLADSLVSHIIRSHSPGEQFRVGVTWVNYMFTDPHNNMATCNFSVTVLEVDTTLPTIMLCPADVTVTQVTNVPRAVSWESPVATDVSETVSVVSQSHFPGDEFPFGVNNVTYTFTDDSGNEATCFFRIYVIEVNNPIASLLNGVDRGTGDNVTILIVGLYIIFGFVGLTLLLLFVKKLLRKKSSDVGKQSYATVNGDAEIDLGIKKSSDVGKQSYATVNGDAEIDLGM